MARSTASTASADAAAATDQRFRFFEAVALTVQRRAADQPLLVVLDDVQWAGPGAIALLEFLPSRLIGTRILVLAAHR